MLFYVEYIVTVHTLRATLQCTCNSVTVRLALGNLVLLGLFMFTQAVREKFGRVTASLLLLITASQFHFMFYMSRTLPNTFALILGLHTDFTDLFRNCDKHEYVSFRWNFIHS